MQNPSLSVLAALALFLFGVPRVAAEGPVYANAETQRVIERMVEAHGGIERWQNAPSVRFDNIFYNPFTPEGGDPWWVAHEVIEHGPKRRAYQKWPIDGARLGYDGTQTWTTNWRKGNPPTFMVSMFYYFVGLPFLTQEPSAVLGPLDRATLPGDDTEYHTVEMTYREAPAVGKTDKDFFKLYIDPESYTLKAYEYGMGYGALLDGMGLPPEVEVFGPMLRIHDAFDIVDGLIVPTRMHTMAPDGSQTWGHHVIVNYDFSEPFDASKVQKPIDAVVDRSSAVRAGR